MSYGVEPEARGARENTHLAVEARGVVKTFGEGALAVPALRGVDFLVERGEFVMLAGPSAAAKRRCCHCSAACSSPRVDQSSSSAISSRA